MSNLQKKAIIITGPGFEDAEVIYPYYRMQEEGYSVDVVTSTNEEVKGKHGNLMKPTLSYEKLNPNDYVVVVIPGGHEAPDRVRQVEKILAFIREINKEGKIISSVCHGPWVLISAGIMKGKRATCYPGMKDDLINAGAQYTHDPVAVDNNIVTSDHPRNLGLFMKTTIELLNK